MPEAAIAAPAHTTPAPASAEPDNPDLKRAIGISLSPKTDRVIVQWVDYLGKIHPADVGRKPTRGTVITEIVEKLLAAGWTPGDQIVVTRNSTPKKKR